MYLALDPLVRTKKIRRSLHWPAEKTECLWSGGVAKRLGSLSKGRKTVYVCASEWVEGAGEGGGLRGLDPGPGILELLVQGRGLERAWESEWGQLRR